MNRVKFNPATLEGEDKIFWEDWIDRADKARKKAIKDYDEGKRPVPFNGDIWSKLKGFLLQKVFKGKCAYCDSQITVTSFGDAEHFRPKGRVTIKKNGKEEIVMVNGEPHPGYYWLAYDWRNLFPACQRCNSNEGKMNQFPLEEARTHVTSPEDGPDPDTLDELEGPLLLHPYKEDFNPDEHLLYGDKGAVAPTQSHGQKDTYGQAIIDVCNLKRGELEADRYKSQQFAWLRVTNAFHRDPAEMDKVLAPYRAGEEAHSRAAYQYVMLMMKAFLNVFE